MQLDKFDLIKLGFDKLFGADWEFFNDIFSCWKQGAWNQIARKQSLLCDRTHRRAESALLIATAHVQLGNRSDFNQIIKLALEWQCDPNLVRAMLISGVYNSAGKFYALQQNMPKAASNFASAVKPFCSDTTLRLFSDARMMQQLIDLGISNRVIEYDEFFEESAGLSERLDKAATGVFRNNKTRKFVQDYWRSSQQRPASYLGVDPTRSEKLVDLIGRFVAAGSVLEVGCNAGRNLFNLKKAGYTPISGIEISEEAVQYMKQTYPSLLDKDVSIINEPVEKVIEGFGFKEFDCVFSMAVFEHIHDDSDWVFSHIARIAKCVITIEDEMRSSERHFPRNYERVFRACGMRQIHAQVASSFGLASGIIVRVFI